MLRLALILLTASCLTAVGQVTYPYNPDGNADGDIAVGDLQDFLTVYGNPFSPSEIMVGDSSLTYWVEQISSMLDSLLTSGEDAQSDPCEGMSTVNYFGIDYSLAPIGNQCWFAEELRTMRYNDGTQITKANSPQLRKVPGNYFDQEALDSCLNEYGPLSVGFLECIQNLEPFDSTLVCLENFQPIVSVDTFEFALGEPIFYYSYGVVQNEKEVCPSGFHVPSWKDFTELAVHVGPSLGGYHLKDDQFWDGDNSYGFAAHATGLVELQNVSSCEDEWSLVADVFQGTTCDSLPSDYSCQELILALIDVFEFGGTLEHDFDWKYFDVLTPEWIELNNASWDSALYVFFEENRSDFLQACLSNGWNAQIDWLDQGRYAEWWIRQPISYDCYVRDAFMSVWGERTALYPIQSRFDGLYMVPEFSCPIRCIKDTE